MEFFSSAPPACKIQDVSHPSSEHAAHVKEIVGKPLGNHGEVIEETTRKLREGDGNAHRDRMLGDDDGGQLIPYAGL